MIEEVFYKDNLYYKVTVKSRPKTIILNYGKIGNKGRTKNSKYSGDAKLAFHNMRDKLLSEGYFDKAKSNLEKKKTWREKKIQQISKSKKIAKKVHNHKIDCPPGQILKDGYVRKGYTRKNGTKVKDVVVKPTCIEKKGAKTKYKPPAGKKGIPPLKSGELSKHGYSKIKNLSKKQRQKALNSAIDEYGAQMVFKKINALKTLQKRTNPEISKTFDNNLRWVRKSYDSQFKGNWKDSMLFKK